AQLSDHTTWRRGAGLRHLRPTHAVEATRPGADGLPHLLPRAAGSALRRARRVPLLLKAPAARRGHRVHDDAPGSRNTNRDRTRYDTTTTTAPEATKFGRSGRPARWPARASRPTRSALTACSAQ